MVTSLPADYRRWEFLYRLVRFCGNAIVGDAEIRKRRECVGVTQDATMHRYAWEEARAGGEAAEASAACAVAAWCELFDGWSAGCDPEQPPFTVASAYVFPDVYAVGFFLAVLEADDVVFYRGQRNSDWQLETSLSRAMRTGTWDQLRVESIRFREALEAHPLVRRFYEDAPVPGWHMDAALQHYGFPTHYLDFTYEFESGAYFAEGALDTLKDGESLGEVGAIYAIPAGTLPLKSTRLVVLPPCFPRPRLQRGVFIEADPDRVDLPSFEGAKYRFAHGPFPMRCGLGDMRWGSAPGFGEFYFPVHDRISALAAEIRDGKVEANEASRLTIEQWQTQWLHETWMLCVHDRGPNRVWVNDHHLRLRCKSEPVVASHCYLRFASKVLATDGDFRNTDKTVMLFLQQWKAALLHPDVLGNMSVREKVEHSPSLDTTDGESTAEGTPPGGKQTGN